MGWFSGDVSSSDTSGFSQTGDSEKDAVSNRDGGKYNESDAGKETGSSAAQTEKAWHSARDDDDADKGADRHSDNSSWWS